MLTPDQQARLDYLDAKYPDPAPAPPDPGPGANIFDRLMRQQFNLGPNIAQGLTNSAIGLLNLPLAPPDQIPRVTIPKPFDIGPAQTFPQKMVDTGAGLSSALLQAAVPAGAVGAGAKLLGAGASAAAIAGDVGAGIFQGLGESPGEGAAQGAEFGALGAANRFLPNPWLKAAANLAIPVGGQLLRGQNPLDQQSLINTGTMVALPLLMGHHVAERPIDPEIARRRAQAAADAELPGKSPYPNGSPFNAPQVAPPPGRSLFPYGEPVSEDDYTRQWEAQNPQEVSPPGSLQEAPAAPVPEVTSASVATAPEAATTPPDLNTHHDEVTRAVQDIASQYPGVDTQTHRTFDDIPEELKARILAQDPGLRSAEGFSDPTTGQQHIISENIPDADRAREVAVHEIVGHHGVDQVINPADWQGIQDHVLARGGDLADSISQDYHGQPLDALDAGQKHRVTREYVARVAEDTNLDPTLWQRVAGAVRSALRAAGIRREWTDADIQDLVRSAHRNLKAGDTGDLIGGSVDAAKKKSAPEDTGEQQVRDAYGRLAKSTGFPAVRIAELAKESGRPLNEVKSLLTREYQGGRALLTRGDWSNSSEETRAGAIDTPVSDQNLLVRLLEPKVDPSLPRRMDEAAQRQEEGDKSILGKVSRFAEINLGMSRSPEVMRAGEKGFGAESDLTKKANSATSAYLKEKPLLTPTQTDAAKAFNQSPGDAAAVSLLKTAALPKSAEEFLTAHKALQTSGQKVISSAETGAHKAVIDKTEGLYQRRAYQLFTDPKAWLRNFAAGKYDKALSDTVKYFKGKPEFAGIDDAIIEKSVRQYLNDKASHKGFQPDTKGSQKISQALYLSKHDLTPPQWKMLEGLQSDPRLPMADRDVIKDAIRDQHLRPADQARLETISKSKLLTDAENAQLHEIAQKETVAPEIRALFGEHTDPFEQAAFTSQKIIGSVRQAKTIAELAASKFDDGRSLAYSTADYSAAVKVATPEVKARLLGYQKLPEADGYGVLAGKWADRGVMDTLDAMNQGMDAGGNRFYAKIQKVMKLNATVLNPSTHAHWWMQMPLMMSMARVYNPAKWLEASQIVLGNNRAHDPIRDELTKNGILNSGKATEAGAGARAVANINEPKTTLGQIKTGGDKAIGFLGKLYGHPDEIIRTASYLNEKGKALAAGLSEEAAQNRAIDFTQRYTFNYKNLPPSVRAGSNIPGLNPFLAYSAELTRITKNLAKDVISGSAEDRTHAALNLALMAAVPLAISMGSSMANLSQQDQADWDHLRQMEGSELKGQIKFVTGRGKDGTFRYFDVGPMLPAGDTFDMVKDILHGDLKAFAADQPLVGLAHSPIASLGIDLSTGENQMTGQKLFTASDYAGRIVQPLLPPLLGSQLQRDVRSFAPNEQGSLGLSNPRTGRQDTPTTSLLGHVGIRMASENQGVLLRAAQSDAHAEQSAAQSDMLRVLATNASASAKERSVLKYQERARDIQQELMKKIAP